VETVQNQVSLGETVLGGAYVTIPIITGNVGDLLTESVAKFLKMSD